MSLEETARINAEARWFFCKSQIEPVLPEAANDPTAIELLPNHEALIRWPEPAICIVKCRKTAHSFGVAMKAVARCATEPRSTTIIGSYDEDEAKEKNAFLEWIIKAICDRRPSLLRELKMSDGSEIRRVRNGARIRFLAYKPPTGAGASIEWDEFSIEPASRYSPGEILTAALGCITHTGSLSIGGTQRGPDTAFNQVVSGKTAEIIKGNPILADLPVPSWRVGKFPWWSSPALCNNVIEAIIEAPKMATEDRVVKYGNEKLKQQYVLYCSSPEQGEDVFQREFEMRILDDTEAYFPLSLIRACYPHGDYWFEHCEIEGAKYGKYGDALAEAKAKIMALSQAIRSRKIIGEWGMAQDVGRHNDQDELWFGCAPANNREVLELHLSIGANLLPFEGKQELLIFAMQNLPITRGAIDGTRGSVGVQLAEWANGKWGQRAQIFEFTVSSKQIICSGVKARMENARIVLPAKSKKFTKLEDQLLKVKKIITPSGMVTFDVERNKQFHGDCFYSAAMLSDLFDHAKHYPLTRPVIGERKVHAPQRGIMLPRRIAGQRRLVRR